MVRCPLLAFVAITITPALAPAQARDRPGRGSLEVGAHPEARHHFRQAQRLVASGRFDAAVKELAAAERFAPDSAVLAFHRAKALEHSGDLDGAIIAYEGYLQRRPDTADRAEIERLIGVVRARVEAAKHLVSVESEPSGARVYIDAGGPHEGPSGVAPMAVRLHPGPHRFYVELEGHQPIDRVVELTAPRTLRFRLSKFDTPAILTIGGMDADTEGAPSSSTA